MPSLGLKETKGALIAGLIENSGVDNKAIEAGDVVIRFDGKPVDTARDLPRLVAESLVGKEVEIVVIRQGAEKTLKVKLGCLVEDDKSTEPAVEDQVPAPDDGEQPGARQETPDKSDKPKKEHKSDAAPSVLGMKLSKLDDDIRGEFGIAEDVEGVAILSCCTGDGCRRKAHRNGRCHCRYRSGDGEDAGRCEKKRIDALRREGRKNALLMLASRSGELRFVTIRID
ncbi:PDZ domain-containing protein [Brucella abortus]|nr:PDZ domain-containing protein [Brucella abortus]